MSLLTSPPLDIESLGRDVLHHIMVMLDTKTLLLGCALVSKKWYSATKDPLLWKRKCQMLIRSPFRFHFDENQCKYKLNLSLVPEDSEFIRKISTEDNLTKYNSLITRKNRFRKAKVCFPAIQPIEHIEDFQTSLERMLAINATAEYIDDESPTKEEVDQRILSKWQDYYKTLNREMNNYHHHQGFLSTALYTYDHTEEKDLSFEEGDILLIVGIEKSDGWWTALNADGKKGLVPSNYLEPVEDLMQKKVSFKLPDDYFSDSDEDANNYYSSENAKERFLYAMSDSDSEEEDDENPDDEEEVDVNTIRNRANFLRSSMDGVNYSENLYD